MIDWIQVVHNLKTVMPLQRASIAVGKNRDYLRTLKLAHTTEPGFEVGRRLLRLHKQVCGRDLHSKLLKRDRSLRAKVESPSKTAK